MLATGVVTQIGWDGEKHTIWPWDLASKAGFKAIYPEPELAGARQQAEASQLSARRVTELAQAVVNGLQMGLLYALVAVGLTIIWGLMEMINFAHGEFLMLGMFGAWWLSVASGSTRCWPWCRSRLLMYGVRRARLPPAHAAGAGRAIRSRRSSRPSACSSCCRTRVVARLHQRLPLRRATALLTRLSGTKLTLARHHLRRAAAASAAGLALVLFLVLYLLIERTEFGLALQATSEDRDAARLVGIRPQRMFAVAWGLGAALVAIAGAILVNFFAVYPQVGLQFTVLAYAIVALGGFGSILGTLLAALLVGVIQSVTVVYLPPAFKDAFVFASYLLIGLFRPRACSAASRRRSRRIALGAWRRPSWRPSSIRFRFSCRARPTTRPSGFLVLLNAMLGVGWNVIGGWAGQFDFGPQVFFGVGAYTAALLYVQLGVDAWLGLLAAVVVAVVLCAVLTYPLTRLRGHYFAIATVAIWMIAQPIGATWEFIGGSQGLFIPVKPRTGVRGIGAVAAVLGADQGARVLLRRARALRDHAGRSWRWSSARSSATTSARSATIRRAPRASASTAGSTR